MGYLFSALFAALYFLYSLFQLVILLVLPKKVIHKIYKNLDDKEEKRRIQSMQPFLSPGDSVLDVGAGSGRFGKIVSEKLGVKITGVDVCDYSDHTIPFFVYDGKKLPFPDKTFDVAFFAFVLHHTTTQETLLQEACRVSKKKVIIFEDTYDNPIERLFVCWNDYQTNILQGWIKYMKSYFKGSPSAMPMPLTFRSVEGWKKLFSTFPTTLTSAEVRTMVYKPLKKVTFCLNVTHEGR